ncbi:MAG: type II toxin-antitoxin system RelE/ParE family toxin [Opitutus sp.]|nr:type II toxin-antitoxin system RelE/ParE family toxin [Opitutus sp.]MCS6247086.1 type II toxin-antitoxin system RelE/ParE family toxin [Opitutus sp.]MCS6274777.1 type II toxin-antitoxin system RelE/ParE family toxin [Opitutus sp.]MCS6275885.1 type II toxin-antitoxin system RelE/ParE family toxin [Opitutus sp.]MCS6300981.1 type II toxin-antitoxin system RelE/ParE family toxin [Opitutus sp.]
MGYQVGLTEEAQSDLGSVVRFLAEKSPAAAERLGHELLDAALALTLFPRRGAPVRRRPGMRKLAHRHYLIFYQINDATQTVEIIRIWDGRQNPTALRFA